MPSVDCVCAGIVVADHVCEPVDHVPAPGELVLTSRMNLSIGGCASNVAVNLARLGRTVNVVGKVGRDSFGWFIRDALESSGVATDHLGESASRDTSGSLVINSQGEDRRFIHSVGANGEFTGDEITPELLHAGRVLYLGGYCLMDALLPEKVAELFAAARAAGTITLLDVVLPCPNDYWPALNPVLPHTDVFLPNDDESKLITGLDDPVEQASAFLRAGAGTVVITCGETGAVLASEGQMLKSGRYDVPFVDGTGSGDAFVSGYIHALLDGADQRKSLRYGSALGASCVRSTGATTGVFDRAELETFVESHSLPIDVI